MSFNSVALLTVTPVLIFRKTSKVTGAVPVGLYTGCAIHNEYSVCNLLQPQVSKSFMQGTSWSGVQLISESASVILLFPSWFAISWRAAVLNGWPISNALGQSFGGVLPVLNSSQHLLLTSSKLKSVLAGYAVLYNFWKAMAPPPGKSAGLSSANLAAASTFLQLHSTFSVVVIEPCPNDVR